MQETTETIYPIAFIYKLESASCNKIYIGSTCQQLNRRFAEHKKDCKDWSIGKKNYITSFDLMIYDDVKIIELSRYYNIDKKQLHKHERTYIEASIDIVVNKYIPTRTVKEWRAQNQTQIKEQMEKYYQDHKDTIKEYQREYRQSHKEQLANRRKLKIQLNLQLVLI